jgi:hypothetical protein
MTPEMEKIVQLAQAGAPEFGFVRKKGPSWIHFSLSKPYRSVQNCQSKSFEIYVFFRYFFHILASN